MDESTLVDQDRAGNDSENEEGSRCALAAVAVAAAPGVFQGQGAAGAFYDDGEQREK